MTSTSTRSTTRPDTRDLVLVHNTFRRCLGDLPGLVRGVPAGDRERAAVLADFYAEVATGLPHHTHEDEYLSRTGRAGRGAARAGRGVARDGPAAVRRLPGRPVGLRPDGARVVWKVLGRRRYRKEIDRIYGR